MDAAHLRPALNTPLIDRLRYSLNSKTWKKKLWQQKEKSVWQQFGCSKRDFFFESRTPVINGMNFCDKWNSWLNKKTFVTFWKEDCDCRKRKSGLFLETRTPVIREINQNSKHALIFVFYLVCVYAYIHIYVYIYMHVYMYIYIYIHMYIYIYIYRFECVHDMNVYMIFFS